ncbi:MAG: hypothetical protein KIT14_24615 [bacterium]|nr:hypothetical protein [bacterium]
MRYTDGMATSAVRAGSLLRRVFAPLRVPVAFRLWDGSTVTAGAAGVPAFTVVLPRRRVLRRLLLRPTPLAFGTAWIDGGLDLEGDLFAAMTAGQDLEGLRPSLVLRAAALLEAVRP